MSGGKHRAGSPRLTPTQQRAALVGAIALGSLVALFALVWGIDELAHRNKVARNVTVAGIEASGLSREEITAQVNALATAVASVPVPVHDGPDTFGTSTGSLGMAVDVDATVDAALTAGRGGLPPLAALRWVDSWSGTTDVGLVVRLDEDKARAELQRVATTPLNGPVEPALVYADGRLQVEPGRPGEAYDFEPALAALRVAAAKPGAAALDLQLRRVPVDPRHTTAEVEQLAAEAERLTAQGLTFTVADPGDGPASLTASPEQLRSWLRSTEAPDGTLTLTVDEEAVRTGLAEVLAPAEVAPRDAGMVVEGGSLVPVRAVSGRRCCSDDAPTLVLDALWKQAGTVPAPLVVAEPDRTDAELAGMGIVEEVASFTTNHACCEPRVQNIHRMADTLRGFIIEPGKMLSINEVVGRRTTDKGYVSAPIIGAGGRMANDVGGGVSQFATTIFNTAFFAGLDFGDYSSHMLYITRYPYGREATLNYPSIDLQIVNNTPYGVLVWPTYTDTSITVTFYSTKHVSGDQTGQEKIPQGRCTQVKTERTRTWTDGRTDVDHVYAFYWPGEGVGCDGSSMPTQ